MGYVISSRSERQNNSFSNTRTTWEPKNDSKQCVFKEGVYLRVARFALSRYRFISIASGVIARLICCIHIFLFHPKNSFFRLFELSLPRGHCLSQALAGLETLSRAPLTSTHHQIRPPHKDEKQGTHGQGSVDVQDVSGVGGHVLVEYSDLQQCQEEGGVEGPW